MNVTEQEVRDSLAELVHADVIDEWMTGYLPLLHGSAVDLIAAGEGQRVLDLLDAIKDGAFL